MVSSIRSPQLSLLGFELSGVVNGFVEQAHGVIEHVVAGDALGQGSNEGVLDLFFGDVGRVAVMSVAVFVVAAPDVAAISASRVPDFPSVPTTTVGALDFACKRVAYGRPPDLHGRQAPFGQHPTWQAR